MFSRPGLRSAVLLAGTWVLGAVIAIAIGYFAIDRVGHDVHDDAALVASSDTASIPPTSTKTTTSPPTTSEPTTAPPAPVTEPDESSPAATPPPDATSTESSRRFEVAGGVVAVRCDGKAITLLYAYPDDGFTAHVDPGPTRIEVEFTSRATESHVKLSCVAGQPAATTDDDEEHHEDGE